VLYVTIDEFVAEALVIPLSMVVLGIFLHRVTELALPKRDDLRQAFRFDRPNESLGVRVQIWASRREHDGPDSRTRQRDLEFLRERRIAIMYQESSAREEPGFGIREI